MADEDKLREELDAVVEHLNDKEWKDESNMWSYEIGTHSGGLAVDIKKGGRANNKVIGQFCSAVMEAGYVASGFLYHGESSHYNHTRVFLNEASEHFDLVAVADNEPQGLHYGPNLDVKSDISVDEFEGAKAVNVDMEHGVDHGFAIPDTEANRERMAESQWSYHPTGNAEPVDVDSSMNYIDYHTLKEGYDDAASP